MTSQQAPHQFAQALGAAVVADWANLSQEIQQRLFETAAAAGQSPEFREALAVFLHNIHPRTG